MRRRDRADSATIQHRGIFITSSANPGTGDKPQPSGTLFHAVFANNVWGLERRSVTNIKTSKSLVLMWRVAAVNGCFSIDRVEEVLQQVPCRADHNTDKEEEDRADLALSANAEKGGFSCVPWTENALSALRDEGVIKVNREIRKFALHTMQERRMKAFSSDQCYRSDCKRGESTGWPRGCQANGGKRLRGLENC